MWSAVYLLFFSGVLAAAADGPPPSPPVPAPWPSADELRERRLASEGRPLFQSADPLSFTLRADFKQVNKDRNRARRHRFPGVLTVTADDGQPRSFPVTLRTRGKFRLNPRNCGFVPLHVAFPKKAIKGTPFEGQDALKLVTHCHDEGIYEQYLLREYATYRVFNLLTPRSFRARLAHATYVDSVTDKTLATRPALWLESEEDVAHRLEGRMTDMKGRLFRHLHPESLDLMMMFQFMIGNTDFSISALHNVRIVQDAAGVLYPVPYDFNNTGLVDAHYAIPSPKLPIRSVLERLYRGPCRGPAELEAVLARFRSAETEVLDRFDAVPDLDKTHRRKARKYVAEFYANIGRPASVERLFVEACNKAPGM